MNSQATLFADERPAHSTSGFVAAYESVLAASGARERFESQPTYDHARGLALSIMEAIHATAPDHARLAIMTSGGKDSTACVAYYLESVRRRIEAGLPFVPASFLFASTGHEFPEMERRIEKERAALDRFTARWGCEARIVRPAARNTVMVELIGNGFALPPKATNDKVAAAGVANWCVSRVKSDVLDAATREASQLAPLVIQILGARHDESSSRSTRMSKYGAALPFGLCRVAMTDTTFETNRFLGCYPISHFSNRHITEFIHRGDDTPHRDSSLIELDYIYSRAAGIGGDVGECSISRSDDGKVSGGCAGLFSTTRLGCALCLRAQNRALRNLAENDPKIYGRLWLLQQEINRHQELVHARPHATKASGHTQDTLFPRGFTFRTRYRWLVMLLAAEIESGYVQLTDEQCAWIERKWARHGVVTIKVADARRDAREWIREGGKVPCFFDGHDDFGDEFTYAVGEGLPIGAFMAHQDVAQGGLNFAHLLGLNLVGGALFPQLQTYVLEDLRDPNALLCMVTDTPAVLGMRTSTGLINGLVGACFRCVGVRCATQWEKRVSDGRHFFYQVKRTEATQAFRELVESLAADPEPIESGSEWSLADFLPGGGLATRDNANRRASVLRQFRRDLATTHEATLRVAHNRRCEDALDEHVLMGMAIHQLSGRRTMPRALALIRVIARLVYLSDDLRDHAANVFTDLRRDLESITGGNYTLLEATNEAGAELRRQLHRRARDESMNGIQHTFEAYLDTLRRLEVFRRAGLANSALVARVAYIVRTSIYDRRYADEMLADLGRSLGLAP